MPPLIPSSVITAHTNIIQNMNILVETSIYSAVLMLDFTDETQICRIEFIQQHECCSTSSNIYLYTYNLHPKP